LEPRRFPIRASVEKHSAGALRHATGTTLRIARRTAPARELARALFPRCQRHLAAPALGRTAALRVAADLPPPHLPFSLAAARSVVRFLRVDTARDCAPRRLRFRS